jgi:hypothetical protein
MIFSAGVTAFFADSFGTAAYARTAEVPIRKATQLSMGTIQKRKYRGYSKAIRSLAQVLDKVKALLGMKGQHFDTISPCTTTVKRRNKVDQ